MTGAQYSSLQQLEIGRVWGNEGMVANHFSYQTYSRITKGIEWDSGELIKMLIKPLEICAKSD